LLALDTGALEQTLWGQGQHSDLRPLTTPLSSQQTLESAVTSAR
jgi:hypothetical protein